jgi:hypothetical protein
MQTNTAKADDAPDNAPAEPQFSVVGNGAPASAGVRRVNLGKLTATAKSKGKYPILPDPTGVIATAVETYLAQFATFEALEGSLKGLKAEFNQWARPFYYQTCRGQVEIPSSVMALSPNSQVLLTFQDRYPSVEPDWDTLGTLLGDRLPEVITETFEIKIDGSKIPPASQQDLIEEVTALFEKHNASAAITAKLKVKPAHGFHSARHTWLTPEQNAGLDAIMPCVMSVKTKGVKR